MYNVELNSRRKPHDDRVVRTIAVNDKVLEATRNGRVNLQPEVAGLHTPNVFNACNTMPELHLTRLLMTSDQNKKHNITRIQTSSADTVVLQTPVYKYQLGDHQAAGFMAQEVPSSYSASRPTASGDVLTVDLHAMYAHLWASVQGLLQRECTCTAAIDTSKQE